MTARGPGVSLRFTPGYIPRPRRGRGGWGEDRSGPRGFASLHPWLHSSAPAGPWRLWGRRLRSQGFRFASPLATFLGPFGAVEIVRSRPTGGGLSPLVMRVVRGGGDAGARF